MKSILIAVYIHVFVCLAFAAFGFGEGETLAIGAKAPDFHLPGVDGKTYSLSSFKDASLLVVIFTCNHCPTAQAYEQRIIQLVKDYSPRSVAFVAINPNNPNSLRLDELGWSDVGDSFDDMKVRAKEKSFNFPYLFDGETETASRLYGPVSTPHVFIFDSDRRLRYNGRIDDQENPNKKPNSQDTRDALEALLNHQEVPVPVTKVFGCSIKWSEKSDWKEKAAADWAKEPVTVNMIDVAGIKELLKNNSENLRLINVWATWCGPCVAEFNEFITINRMYRDRDFEFVSISADDPSAQEKVLKFLKRKQASNANYLFSVDDKYKLIEAIDPKWQGALPYTILIEPGGKIVYAKQAAIDPAELKQIIFNDSFMGRLYK